MNKETNNYRVNITTKDNPYDPFDDFYHWFLFDTEKGYYTSSKLARLTKLTSDMTEREETLEIERAIDRLIEIDPFDEYVKIKKEYEIEDNDKTVGGGG